MKYFIVVFTLFFSSCVSKVQNEEPTYVPVNLPKEEAPKEIGYYCPMKCEDEKVYATKKNPCPVCEMKLIPTK